LDPNIEKQVVREYLLGNLEADRRMALEESILCDPEVYEELLLVEEELIDQYVSGTLSRLEQHQFETHFLITADRQKNLRFGRLLKKYLNSQSVLAANEDPSGAVGQARKIAPAKMSFSSYLGTFRRGPALGFAALFVICTAIVFLWWLGAKKQAQGIAQENSQPVVIVTLTPGLTRSSGGIKRIAVPPRGADVKLELELANATFNSYKSQLFRESEELQTRDKLKKEAKGDQHVVPLTITGEILSPGDYQVRLSGVLESGQDQFIDNYSFRVIIE
jgi:hypothetical protein